MDSQDAPGHDLITAAESRERSVNERMQLVVAEFGDGLPWQPEHYEHEIRSELRRGCESFLRAGRLLVVARECATHGEWQRMLDKLGMEPRQAQRMMEAARRMAALPNASAPTHLIAAVKNQTKLIELLSLPEDQFAELAETGETNGLTRDAISNMTFRELRAAVREAREGITRRDEAIAQNAQRINELRDEVARTRREYVRMSPDEQRIKLKQEITKALATVEVHISESSRDGGLHGALMQLHDHLVEHGGNETHWVISQLDNLIRAVNSLKLAWPTAL